MKKVALLLLIILCSPIAGWCIGNCNPLQNNSIRYCTDNQIISVSGAQIVIYSNGGLVATFEEIIAGAPTTVSITIQGCGVSGTTCETIDTNTTVANSLRSPAINKTYYTYVVTATWTGGTSPTVTVNTQQTSASLNAAPTGAACLSGTVVPCTVGAIYVSNYSGGTIGWTQLGPTLPSGELFQITGVATLTTNGTGGSFQQYAGSNVTTQTTSGGAIAGNAGVGSWSAATFYFATYNTTTVGQYYLADTVTVGAVNYSVALTRLM